MSHHKYFYSPFLLCASNNFQELKESSLSAVLIHQKHAISFTYFLTAVTPPELGERSCSLLNDAS